MARPKLGESETERLHIKITKDELDAIDNWRYENRIPSRSEAVRRLCSVAIVTLNGLNILRKMTEDASVSALDDYETISGHFRGLLQDSIDGNEHGFTYHEAKDLLQDYSNRAYWQDQNSKYINRVVAGITDAIGMMTEPQSFGAVEQNAQSRLVELDTFINLQHNAWDAMAEHHQTTDVIRLLSEEDRISLNKVDDSQERREIIQAKVVKYRTNQKRRMSRLRSKLRADDKKMREAVEEIFSRDTEDNENSSKQ